MGFHLCEWCYNVAPKPDFGIQRFHNTSSGDVTLRFGNCRAWQMPDMITHYIADHGWQPPLEFVSDVMTQKVVGGERIQTRSIQAAPIVVGYLSGVLITGPVPDGFVEKLSELMMQADKTGNRVQTKGLSISDLR